MASVALTNITNSHRHAWAAPATLVAAHLLFNLFVDPLQDNRFHWAFMLAGGVITFQPVLFGAWAALGPPPTVKRVPLTLAAYALVMIGPAVWRQYANNKVLDIWFFIEPSILFVLTFAAMLLPRRIGNWRIDRPSTVGDATTEINQFSLRNFLVFTAICAALLTVGRSLPSKVVVDSVAVAEIIVGTGIFLMVIVPAVFVPLAALVEQLPKSLFVALPLMWAALSAISIYAIGRITSDSSSETAVFIAMAELGALLGGLASALILRFNGYRLYRNHTANPAASAVIC